MQNWVTPIIDYFTSFIQENTNQNDENESINQNDENENDINNRDEKHDNIRNYNDQYYDEEEKSNQKENDLENKEYLKTILKYIPQAVNSVDLHDNLDNCLLFVGPCGSGKSTTIAYLNDIPMTRRIKGAKLWQKKQRYLDDSDSSESELEEDYVYDFDKTKYNGPQISRATFAERLCFRSYKNELWDLFLCECPDFFDNRGMPSLVAAMVGNNLLLKKAKNIKGVAIIYDYNSLRLAKAKNFIDGVVKVVDEMFHPNSNFDSIFNSLLFIFTKVPKKIKTRDIYSMLMKLKIEAYEFQERYIKYLTYILNKANIVILRPDDNHGTYKVEKKRQSKTAIGKKILNFNGIPKDNFKFIGDEDTRRKLEGIAAKAIYKILKPLKYILKEAPNNFIQLELQNAESEETIKTQKCIKEIENQDQLIKIILKIDKYIPLNIPDFEEFKSLYAKYLSQKK